MHPKRLQSAVISFALSLLLLSLLGCAAPPPADPSANTHSSGSKHAAMMDAMCKKHAAKSAEAGSAPGMMDKHCKPDAASAAASAASAPPAAAHVH
jgi:hypothetical protein